MRCSGYSVLKSLWLFCNTPMTLEEITLMTIIENSVMWLDHSQDPDFCMQTRAPAVHHTFIPPPDTAADLWWQAAFIIRFM